MVEWRSNCQRKPVVPFDGIVRPPARPIKPQIKFPKAPEFAEPDHDGLAPAIGESTPAESSKEDPVQLLYEQLQGLSVQAEPDENIHGETALADSDSEVATDHTSKAGIKKAKAELIARKKAKAKEVADLKRLTFKEILEKFSKLNEVIFEPFSPGRTRDPEVILPDQDINATDPLSLLDLFIQPVIYDIIVENMNLYAIAHGAATAPTLTNTQYWWPTNANEI